MTSESMRLGTIISGDGTPIHVEQTGSGSPLVLVHGTTASSMRWVPILPALAEHHTVYAMDRRGRGKSGDAAPYAVEREFEDVAAVVDQVAREHATDVDVLGHSFGGLCVLEAALRTARTRRLVVYEPAPSGLNTVPAELVERMQRDVDAGDREGALLTMLREVVRMPETEVDLMRSKPAWQARVAAAHTIPRELRAVESYYADPTRLARIDVPTLLLLGGASPEFFRNTIEALQRTLPHAKTVALVGQQHAAIDTAPERFVREVLAFLL